MELALKKDQIIVRLSPRLKQLLENKSKEKEMSVSEFVRLLIENAINEDNSSNG
jgi:predicted DNA-binding protein